MKLDPISIQTISPELGKIAGQTQQPQKADDFSNLVFNKVNEVNEAMQQSDKISTEFLTEGKHDLHEVMIAIEKADLSFRFMNQVRNKVLDAYNEVMRMQV